MQGRPRLQAVNHRDVAAQFRSLAAIEPLPSLRDRLRGLLSGTTNWRPDLMQTSRTTSPAPLYASS